MTYASLGHNTAPDPDLSLAGRMQMARRYVTSLINGRIEHHNFRHVDTYCMFIGHARSGHSIVGALLDAHPRVILPDEVDVLQFVAAGFGRDQIFHLLLKRSRIQARKGRTKGGRDGKTYSYQVPNQWQGRFSDLKVMGSSKAGRSTQHLAQSPALLQRLRRTMRGAAVKVVHVVRNPYDNISTMHIRGGRPLPEAIERYFENCTALEQLRRIIPRNDLHLLRQEALIAAPQRQLQALCAFLALDASDAYLQSCAGMLYTSPAKSRHGARWSPDLVEHVRHQIKCFDFLEGYRYDD